jgi:hypothetical protein
MQCDRLIIACVMAGGCGGRFVSELDEPAPSTTSGSSSSSSASSTGTNPGINDGAACTSPAECTSGFCVDGVCCTGECGGTCVACSAAKSGAVDGTCSYIKNGQDPDDECAGTPTCNGEGDCTYPCDASSCLDLGYGCGICLDESSTCGKADEPWAGWDTPHEAQDGDSIAALAATGDLSGMGCNNDSATPTGNFIDVGETGDLVCRGGVTFDFGFLPAEAKIVSATLSVHQSAVKGAAYSELMTTVVLDHVRFANLWQLYKAIPIAASFVERELASSGALGWISVDVTEAVRYDIASCTTRTQLRLRFTPKEAVPSNQPNVARFDSDDADENVPRLDLRYR